MLLTGAVTLGWLGIEVGASSLAMCAFGLGVKGGVGWGACQVVCFSGGRVEVGVMFAERAVSVTKVA
tara:strand:- start:2627 stop:2827 length:201 start_codon:yes stop_codon:yes gene_type:complete